MRVIRALWFGAALWGAGWLTAPVIAGEAVVLNVEVAESQAGGFDFHVTVQHADTGWEHYAQRWEVRSLDGETAYGERVLLHPHVEEQPFTRSLRAVSIPRGVREVQVRAEDKQHGWGKYVRVPLPGR